MEDLKKLIQAEADSLGFSFISFTHASQTPHYSDFLDWLAHGFSGEMQYLTHKRTIQSRRDPSSLLDNAKSMIVFGFHYPLLTQNLCTQTASDHPTGWIASYACHQDYHSLLKKKARLLVEKLIQFTGNQFNHRIFVDSTPLMEKDTAYMAGAGWIGKNSLLLTPYYGSTLVIGCILTDMDLPANKPFSQNLCRSCRQCINACPTECITENRNIDASRCVAYLTIEHKGIIPRDLRSRLGNWIFGCDICQNACPINKNTDHNRFENKSIFTQKNKPVVDLVKEIEIDSQKFLSKYKDTPVLRATLEGYKRNLIIAMGNSKSRHCIAPLEKMLSSHQPWNLRLHAAWALGEIHTRESLQIIEKALGSEQDEKVRTEILLTLNEYQ